MDSHSQEYPARLRATLANFYSYCQRHSQSAARLSSEKTFNTTITRYRSIREVNSSHHKHDIFGKSPTKRLCQQPAPKTQEETLPLKSSDLIEMIKLKLKDSTVPQSKKTQTEANERVDIPNRRYSKKGAEMAAYLLKTVKFGRNPRKKKLDLAVSNTKCQIRPREEKPEKYKEVVIALKSRPASAIAYRTTVNYLPSQNKIDYKYSSPEVHRPHLKNTKIYRKSTEGEKNKELSGWQIPDLQESFFQPGGGLQKKSMGRKKGKSKRKG